MLRFIRNTFVILIAASILLFMYSDTIINWLQSQMTCCIPDLPDFHTRP
ncbi:hypothetical protein [Halalkalibacter alkaliphilus]|uniref:Uncharacterized protein n=1 Tax=Halalkalibacter alkaliphilus TaxID=2917993 RepID=A0A9X2I834_9BACI|nr:hypothetical protein [Halalkalibacter alkaliphilus]MCL7748030.1 hypothetical protein [Halalkalibacter alkaliphilus]